MAFNFKNAKEKLVNALLGTPVQTQEATPSVSYGEDIDNYLNTLETQPYMQPLLNQPKETALTLEQYQRGVANGLNYGIKEIADMQDKLGIRKPQTGDEKYAASLGEFNQPSVLNIATSNAPRQGGAINDFTSGYRENATQGFNVNNLAPQKKSLATRIGEGLGTLTRFYNSPLGRMAVATGLSMLTDEVNPLNEGVKAYVGRQTNMTRDKAYRQGLINMGVDEAQVNAIPGIVSDDVFSNIARAKQLQDYALYRQDMINTQRENAEALNNYRMAQLEKDVRQNELENYYKRQQLAQGWEKIKNDKENAGTLNFNNKANLRKEFTSIPAIKNANEIKRQLDNVTSTYNSYKSGKIRANAADQVMVTTLNKILDPTSVVRESEFARTAAGQSLLAKTQGYADKMVRGGGGLTNAEREDLYNTMLQMYDAQQKEAQEYVKSYTELAKMYNINPAEIMPRQYLGGITSNNATTQVGSYQEGQTATNPTTGAKIIFRGGKWQTL